MRFKLAAGTRISRAGVLWDITEQVFNMVRIIQVGGAATRTVSIDALLQEYQDGFLHFLETRRSSLRGSQALKPLEQVKALSDYDEIQRAEVSFRLRFIEAYLQEDEKSLGDRGLGSLIEKVMREVPERLSPSPSTVRRWIKNYCASGNSPQALVSRHGDKGSKSGKVSPELENLLHEYLNDCFLKPERPSMISVYRKFRAHALESAHASSVPSYKTFVARCKTVHHFEKLNAQEGKYAALKGAKTFGAGPFVSRPLERVEIDHTTLDVFVIEEIYGLKKRPTLTFAIDVFTRAVLGYCLSFGKPSLDHVMTCLEHAILPKPEREWSKAHEMFFWPMCGLPELLAVDNGKEFVGSNLESAMRELGISVTFSPPYCPWFKGTIERHFRTLNTRLIHNLPGTTKGSIKERGEQNPAQFAQFSLEEISDIIERFIVTGYHVSLARTAKMTPFDAWKIGTENHCIELPESPRNLSIILSRTEERIADHKGVQVNSLRYNSAELTEYVNRKGGKANISVRFPTSDMSRVYAFNSETKDYMTLECASVRYLGFGELNLWQHLEIVATVRKKNRELTDDVLLAARAAFANQIEFQIRGRHKSVKKKQDSRSSPLNQLYQNDKKMLPNRIDGNGSKNEDAAVKIEETGPKEKNEKPKVLPKNSPIKTAVEQTPTEELIEELLSQIGSKPTG